MAFYLFNNAQNARVTLPSSLVIGGSGGNVGDYIEVSAFAISGNSTGDFRLAGVQSSFLNLLTVKPGNNVELVGNGLSVTFSTNMPNISLNDDFKLRLEYVSSGVWEVRINDNLVQSVNSSATFTTDQFLNFASINEAFQGGVYYIEASTSGGTATNRWENVVSNAAGSTWVDTIGSNDGTLVNFATDGSQWVSYTPPAPADTTAPVINLSPSTLTYNLTVGDTFNLPTATLTDDTDSTVSISPTSNNVNTAAVGSYSVVYSGYQDAAGNVASPVTITVNVAAANQLPTANAGATVNVAEGQPFVLDGSGSIDPDGTITSYEWVQTLGQTVILSNANSAIANSTAPIVLGGNETLSFALTVTDNNGGQSTSSVDVIVQDTATSPIADAGEDGSVNSGETYTLNSSGSSDAAQIVKYKWTQISGAYVEWNQTQRSLQNPTFAAPEFSIRNTFAQDIYGPLKSSSPTTLELPEILNRIADVTYAGAMRVNANNGGLVTDYTEGCIALSDDKANLWVTGNNTNGIIAKFEIPATLSQSDVISSVPNATVVQNYVRVLNQNTVITDNAPNRINGILEFGGSLLVTSEVFYDASGTTLDNLQVLSDVNDLENGGNKGYLQLNGAAKVGGWMQEVPTVLKSLIGHDYVCGWGFNNSIAGRYSQGPSLAGFDPQDAINQTLTGDRTVPSTILMNYDSNADEFRLSSQPYGYYELNDPLYNTLCTTPFAFFIPNTNYIMYLGHNGGIRSEVKYKGTQTDGNVCGGQCPLDPMDYYNYFWLYDANDIVNAENPQDPRPISHGIWSHPFDNDGSKKVLGGAFDDVNNRLYLCIEAGAQTGQNDVVPMIIAYDIVGKQTPVSTMDSALTDMVFELEVTNADGLSSTDTVTVTLAGAGAVDTTPPVITFSPPQTVYNLTVGANFTAPTATAIDSIDGVVTVTSTGTVNTATAGAYFLTYTATDAAGNVATRTVTVNVTPEVIIDATAPVITVSGQPITTIPFNGTAPVFTVTATDNIDGTLTAVQTGDTVNTGVAGTYVLRWNVTDSSGNAAQEVTRTVVVLPENVTPTTSMATVIVDGTPNGTYDVNFTNPTTGDLIDIQSLVFVGGRATTQIDVVAGTSFRAHVFTPTHLFGNVGVTV